MLKGRGADIFALRIGPKSLIMGKLPMHVWKGRIEEGSNALILWCRQTTWLHDGRTRDERHRLDPGEDFRFPGITHKWLAMTALLNRNQSR